MEDSNQNEGEVEMRKIPTKEEIDERKGDHNHASKRVAPLPSNPIDHIGDPWTTEDRREGQDTHDDPNVRLGTSMLHKENGKEEEGAKTRYDKQVGKAHNDERPAIEHGGPS